MTNFVIVIEPSKSGYIRRIRLDKFEKITFTVTKINIFEVVS